VTIPRAWLAIGAPFALRPSPTLRRRRASNTFQFFSEENAMNATFRKLLVGAAVAVLSVVTAAAQAQHTGFGSAGWKQGVQGYWPAQASGRYIETARNYAQAVQTYAASTAKPDAAAVKEFKGELTRYLDEAHKHLATMKKDLANDKEAVAAIEGLEKQLASAVAHNKEMVACCEHVTFDKVKAMSCCTDLVKALDKISADHAALMKTLAAKYPAQK